MCGSLCDEQKTILSSHLQLKKSSASRFLQTAQRFRVLDGDDESGDGDIEDTPSDDDDGIDIDDSGSDDECRIDDPLLLDGIGIGIGSDGEYGGDDVEEVEVAAGTLVSEVEVDGSEEDDDGEANGDEIGVVLSAASFFGALSLTSLAHREQ